MPVTTDDMNNISVIVYRMVTMATVVTASENKVFAALLIDTLGLGIHNTMTKLLPEAVAKTSPVWPLTRTSQPGIGCLSVFIGLRGTSEELGLKAQNTWAFTSSGMNYVTFTETCQQCLFHYYIIHNQGIGFFYQHELGRRSL